MRRILIPLNVSEISSEILPVVRHLFAPAEAELILLGVTQRPDSALSVDAYVGDIPHSTYVAPCSDEEWQSYRQHFEMSLKRFGQTLREEGYRVHTLVRVGEPVAQILAAAASGNYDLIAMATYGRTGLARLVMGSVAESVLRQATIPLLLMRSIPQQETNPQVAEPYGALSPLGLRANRRLPQTV